RDRRIDSNIVFIIELGDCTQNGELNEIEWKRADTAIKTIENPSVPIPDGIPYSICVGNHDQGNAAGSPTAPTTRYNQYFGSTRFSSRSYYGGFFGSNYDNHYELFSASGIDFIHISIEYNNNSGATNQTALQNVLNWADGLLKAHPTRKAIISSHWFMGTGINGSFGGPGQKVYDDLKDNPNVILMLCGHIHGEGRRTDVFNGSTIHTVLSDYQGYPNGGNGYLRIMQFKPSENVVTFKTYSPTVNGVGGFQSGSNSDFSLPVNFGGTSYALLGTNSGVASGSATNFTWNGLLPATSYEWYVTIDDGTNTTTSSVFQFTTAGSLPLKLVNLKAINQKSNIRLDWTTSDEVNTKEFEIEKSADGQKFSKLDIVSAKRNSGLNNYQYFDEKPLPEKSFYRLKMKDTDGKFTYSRIVVANRSAKGNLEVIPNPATNNEIRIVWNYDNKDEIQIRIFDQAGRLQVKRTAIATGNEIIVKHNLQPGIYNVDLVTKDSKQSRQIIVR
ncbi:MAG TPA: T9SS type A sorting domain-containing protein, partial [Chitinophagaceae bacterium]|nr:T9SS type A sorting domain-containing protein [Chitinophagaceae bacterium]